MATIQITETDSGANGRVRILRFQGIDCIAGPDTTVTFDCSGFDYAIVYGVELTNDTVAGSGRADFRAVNGGGSTQVAFRSAHATGTGVINAEEACLLSTSTTIVGSRIDKLPARAQIVHDGANTGTAFTIDIYVELHRNIR